MTSSPVLTEQRDAVLLITLNRPDALNAVDEALANGVAAALDRLDDDDELRVGVLTGAGRGFSAGMDLRAFAEGERGQSVNRGFAGIVERPPIKPLIVAVEGFAIGGGLEIALSCDLIVSARNARFGLPETGVGLVAGGGGSLRLPAQIPYRIALEMLLTAQPITAERAYEVGLINVLADPGQAVDEALAMAKIIANNAPMAVRVSKQIVTDGATWVTEQRWQQLHAMANPVTESEDAQEGARAFIERRRPQWKGR